MIYLLCPGSFDAASVIVASALERSCGKGQVCRIHPATWLSRLHHHLSGILLIIHPLPEWADLIIQTQQIKQNKIILFGTLPSNLFPHLGAQPKQPQDDLTLAAICQTAPAFSESHSDLMITYHIIDPLLHSPITQRPFIRYDFTNEWNNLGYGAIQVDGSIWSICQQLNLLPKHCLAHITLNNKIIGTYAGLWKNILWFNRSVGPVDSHEWHIVENYIAHFAHEHAVCQPIFSEIPYSYNTAVTMRLDCDEDVESARPLWNTYQDLNVPFSLALHTKILEDEKHHQLPQQVLAKNGAVLSHTATHAAHWGGNYDTAFKEAHVSATKIKSITRQTVRYAVSPFHHTPTYARIALADAGYEGCIGGIICSDPDFIMARAGVAPYSPDGFIGHTQQCMLHGDCMQQTNPLKIYKQAFNLAQQSDTFFGYLDHPFSERYQYGWESEQARIKTHIDFIQYIRTQGRVLFANESDALDFLQDRANVSVHQTSSGFYIKKSIMSKSHWKIVAKYKTHTYTVSSDGVTL